MTLVLPAHSQSSSSPITTSASFSLSGNDPYNMSCSISAAATPSGAGPTGTVTFTDTAGYPTTTLATAQLVPVSLTQAYTTPEPESGEVAGDFNNDGIPDLLVYGGPYSHTVSILLGKPDGTFQPPIFASTGMPATSQYIRVGDFNGDGKLDLGWVYEESGLFQVILGNGDGSFNPNAAYYGGFSPNYWNSMDIHRDGFSAVLVESRTANKYTGVVHVWWNIQVFTPQPASLEIDGDINWLDAWDVNGDGKIDLLGSIANSSGLQIYLNNGNGTFQQVTYDTPVGTPSSFAAGYFNNDGALDLAVSNGNTIGFLFGNGDGTFRSDTGNTLNASGQLFTGHFLQKDKQELAAVSGSEITVFAVNGDGTFGPAQSVPILPASGVLATADINGDGLLELLGNGWYSLGNFASTAGTDPSVTVYAGTYTDHYVSCSYSGDANFAPSQSQQSQHLTFPQLNAPVFSITPGPYVSSLSMSDSSPGASIYYTTDGSTPTIYSKLYTGAIPITSTSTFEAFATNGPSNVNSQVAQASYQVPNPPYFSLPAGNYSGTQSVTIQDSAPAAAIYYTTDGTTPSTSSAVYTAPIPVSGKMTIQAMALSAQILSPVAAISYNTPLPASSIALASSTNSTTLTPSGPNPPINLTAAVSGTKPTGTVTFASNGSNLATVSVVNGSASFQPIVAAAGPYAFTASYSGDNQNAASVSSPVNVTVAPAVSTTVLSTSATSLAANQTFTLRAAVTADSPTGTVTFSAGAITLGQATVSSFNGVASLQASFAYAGGYTITAAYSGDANNAASTSNPVYVIVGPLPVPTVSVVPVAPNITSAQDDTVNITVTGPQGFATPTGTVSLSGGGWFGSGTLSSGTASIHIPPGLLFVAANSMWSGYSGDSNYASASGTTTITVTAATPTVTAVPTSTGITTQQGDTINITVSTLPGAPIPTGWVNVSGGGWESPSTTLQSGIASVNIPAGAMKVGTNTVTAIYTNDRNTKYTNATGTTTVTVTLVNGPTTTALSVSSDTDYVGQQITLTATVFGSSPTGSVTFKAGSNSLGQATLANGTATLQTSFATPGNYSITATYSGDAQNAASTSGALSVVINPSAPTFALTVTPASGAGTVQSFALAYSDSAGVSDLSWVYALFTPNGDGAHACGVYYHPGSNLIYLADDNNTTVLGPGAVGQPGTLSNSQCTIDIGASSTSVTGNTVTLNLVTYFKVTGTFNGQISTYMFAEDNESDNSGFVNRGSWTVDANVFPTAVSVTPSAGSGTSQTFAFTYSDGNGAADLQWVYGYLSTSADATNSCYFWYHPSDNLIYLADDNGGGFGPGAVGQAGTLTNNECTLNVGASSVSRTPNTLTLNVALNFEGQPAGQKNIYMFAQDNEGHTSTPQSLGTFTVTTPSFHAVSATPVYGPGYHSNQNTFTVTFSDPNGGSAITFAYVLFSPNNDGAHACAIYVQMPSKLVYLANDANDAVSGPGEMGSPGILSNSQCAFDVGSASAAVVGLTALQVNLPVTFASAFDGPLNIIAYAQDNTGQYTGYQNIGTYTVSAPVAPTYVYGTQNGAAAPTVYTRFADANGNQDLQTLYILVGPTLNPNASCYVRYEKANNTIYLSDDAGGWRGPGQPALILPGSSASGVSGSLSNNECTIDTGDSLSEWPVNSDPTLWQLDVPITQYAAPSGTVLNVYMNAVDNEGNSAGWVQKGTWIVP